MGFNKRMKAFLVGAMIIASTASVRAETTLNFSNWLPTSHFFYTDIIQVWAKNIEEATEGRVKINILPKVVGTVPTQYDVVVDGLADIVLFIPGYSPGRFDVSGVGEVPLLSSDTKVSAVAWAKFYEDEIAELNVFKGVHVLATYSVAAGHFMTRDEPITSVEQLKGMKFRSPLPVTNILLDNMGAVPVSKPVSQNYELMASGVIDGTLAGYDQIKGFKLDEVAGGYTEIPGGLYNSLNVIAMNQSKWDALSVEDQAAISRVSGVAFAEMLGDVYDVKLAEGKAALVARDIPVVVADDAFVEAIRVASEPVYARIIELAGKAGAKDPDMIIERLRKKIEEVDAEYRN